MSSTSALFGAIAIAFVLACSDSTAPIPARVPGSYELTTVLHTFTYSYRCLPLSKELACDDSIVVAGASTLHGSFTLGDTVQGSSEAFQFPVTDIVLHQADCALTATQCSERIGAWRSGDFALTRDSLSTFALLNGEVQISLKGRLVGDRIVGDISWATVPGCCAIRRYDGTFVAVRQP